MISPNILLLLPIFVGFASAVDRTVENSCPEELKSVSYYLQIYGDKCVFFVTTESRNFPTAKRVCAHYGGALAMPKTRGYNNFLARELYDTYGIDSHTWIGLDDSGSEGNFHWVDKTPLGRSNFALWNGPTNLVRNHVEDCVAIDPRNAAWHDHRCYNGLLGIFIRGSTSKPFICEFTREISDDQTGGQGGQGTEQDDVTEGQDDNTEGQQDDATEGQDDNTEGQQDDNTEGQDDNTEGQDDNTEGQQDDATEGQQDDNTEGQQDDATEGQQDDNTEGHQDDATEGQQGEQDDGGEDVKECYFDCNLDCGFDGYNVDNYGCLLCECASK